MLAWQVSAQQKAAYAMPAGTWDSCRCGRKVAYWWALHLEILYPRGWIPSWVVSALWIVNRGVCRLKALQHAAKQSWNRDIHFRFSDLRTENCFKANLQQAEKIKTIRDQWTCQDSRVQMVGWRSKNLSWTAPGLAVLIRRSETSLIPLKILERGRCS